MGNNSTSKSTNSRNTTLKPGQFYWYGDVLFRIKRKTRYCEGCFYKGKLPCPNTQDNRYPRTFDCNLDQIILQKV